jgi:hypothetical protein
MNKTASSKSKKTAPPKPKPKPKKPTKKEKPILVKGYKAFTKNLTCLNKQYNIGETYTEPQAELCTNGMHFCANPLDVLQFYHPSFGTRYAQIEATNPKTEIGEPKSVTKELKIIKELSPVELITEAISKGSQESYSENTIKVQGQKHKTAFSIGTHHIAVADEYSTISAVEGCLSVAIARYGFSASLANGPTSVAIATGVSSIAVADNYDSVAVATSSNCLAQTTGQTSIAATTYTMTHAEALGDHSVAATTGLQTSATAGGSWSLAATINEDSTSLAKGTEAVAIVLGNRGKATASENAILAIAIGRESTAKGRLGSWIVLAERDKLGKIIAIHSAQIDGQKYKSNTEYCINNGKIALAPDPLKPKRNSEANET